MGGCVIMFKSYLLIFNQFYISMNKKYNAC